MNVFFLVIEDFHPFLLFLSFPLPSSLPLMWSCFKAGDVKGFS